MASAGFVIAVIFPDAAGIAVAADLHRRRHRHLAPRSASPAWPRPAPDGRMGQTMGPARSAESSATPAAPSSSAPSAPSGSQPAWSAWLAAIGLGASVSWRPAQPAPHPGPAQAGSDLPQERS